MLVGGVRDLQIVDSDGRRCGIVDDVEFTGKAGGPLRPKALLVGPGAWRGRLPDWLCGAIERLFGGRLVRVPWRAIERIDSEVHLKDTARSLRLGSDEEKARRWIPRRGAL
jgi:sporulation protein YlmC with PRC-barrel domain